ncbi:retroviral-like aspartic protease family protein [Kordiimonas sp.]|uniref:retroviral-like aspartic protease family protein n=1 Tax=Kordiimonas sp. TaxID=1970157 RepID=UPI003A92065D
MGARRTSNGGSLRWLPLFVLAVLCTAAVRAGDYITISDNHGRRLVDTQVDGHGSFPFLLDTAASHTVVYRKLVSEAGLAAIPLRSSTVFTATGRREMQIYRITAVTALGRVMPVGETVAMPDPGGGPATPYGILGADFLRGHVLVVDGGRVRLLSGRAAFQPDTDPDYRWHAVAGRAVGRGSVAVDVVVAGLVMPAIIDTGAAATVINPRAADRLRQDTSGDIDFNAATLSAAAGRMQAESLHVPRLDVGGVVLRDVDILSANLPVFTTYGAARAPAMILGADILFGQPVAIDFEHRVVYLGQQKN